MAGFHKTDAGLLLPNSVRTKKNAAHDLDELEVFARNGTICFNRPLPDGSSTEFIQIGIDSARHRLKAAGENVDRYRVLSVSHKAARDFIGPLTRFIERLTAAIKEAEIQGPFQYADMRRARVRSAPVTVSMAKVNDF